MKKKRTGWIVLIIVLVILVAVLGLILTKYFEPKPEKEIKTVCEEIGTTIRVEELVSMESYRSATISEIIMRESCGYGGPKVLDDGQAVYLGLIMCEFEVIVYVTDEDGEVTEERVEIVTKIKD